MAGDAGVANILWTLLTWRYRDRFLLTNCLPDKEEMCEQYVNLEEHEPEYSVRTRGGAQCQELGNKIQFSLQHVLLLAEHSPLQS